MTDAALREAYLATRYVVAAEDASITLEIGRPSPDLDALLAVKAAAAAAFVTAWNPRSERLPDAENACRARALAAAVAALELDVLPVTATADDPRWIEAGLLILGISEVQARELGKRFGQNAIVMIERGAAPRLIELVSPGAAS